MSSYRQRVNQPVWSLEGPRHQAPGNHVAAADWTVALFNRGTPGFAVDTAGAFHVSLLRSCTGFPAGVWIDPPRRAAPDGSNFQAEHWSHVYDHALVAGEGDWRSAGFVAQSQEFNTALQAWLGPTRENGLAPTGSLLQVVNTGPGQVLLSALKPAGNPLARGRLTGDESGLLVTVRLYETAGRPAEATLRPGLGLAMTGATATNMLEEPGEALRCPGGELMLSFAPFEIRTVCLALQEPTGAGGKRPIVGAPPAGAPTAEAPTAEAARPVFSRYWLHNKGPAPVGNQALGVHLSSSWVAARAGDEPVPVLATITSDVSDATQAGTLEIVTPEGWRAEPPSAPFELAPGAHLDVPVRLVASDRVTPGRYFVAARVADTAGQPQEDVVTVDLLPWHPLGPYAPDDGGVLAGLEPAGGFRHPGSQAAAEIEASVRPEALVVAPGSAATLELAVTNRTNSALWGEAQLVSPIETWPFTGPWSQGFRVERGAETTVRFWAKVPGDAVALSSWLLVKVMYFGRLWYSPTVPFQIAPGAEHG